MADELSSIELILEKCLEGAESIESTETMTPELFRIAEEIALQSSKLLDIAAANVEEVEQNLGDKSSSLRNLTKLISTLKGLSSASGCLATHLRIINNLLVWTLDEDRYESIDEGLVVFSEALGEAENIQPPNSIPKIVQAHNALIKSLQGYEDVYSKLKEGRNKRDSGIVEEASMNLSKLEFGQLLESNEMYGLKDDLEEALATLHALKREMTNQGIK